MMERVIVVGVEDDIVVSVADVRVVIGDGVGRSVDEPDNFAAKLVAVVVVEDEDDIFDEFTEAAIVGFAIDWPFAVVDGFFAFSCGFPGVGRTMFELLLLLAGVKRFFATDDLD